MKYLKLFEDINNYYKQISLQDLRKATKKRFEPDIILKLKKFLSERNIEMETRPISRGSADIDFITFNTIYKGVDIHMSDDEWFIVSILWFTSKDPNNTNQGKQYHYLCDQWEGFIQLLNDLVFNN